MAVVPFVQPDHSTKPATQEGFEAWCLELQAALAALAGSPIGMFAPFASDPPDTRINLTAGTLSHALGIVANNGAPVAEWQPPVFADGLWMLAPSNGSYDFILTSPDGRQWMKRTLPASASWNPPVFVGGSWVLSANTYTTNYVLTSSDGGVTWQQRTLPVGHAWAEPVYQNGVLVMSVSSAYSVNYVLTSSDGGVTWQQRTLPVANKWQRPVFGNGVWLLTPSVAANYVLTSSDNGATWQQRVLAATNTWQPAFGGGSWMLSAATSANYAVTSADGVAFVTRTMPTTQQWQPPEYGGGVWILTPAENSSVNYLLTSSDSGATWQQRTLPATTYWRRPAYANGLWMLVRSVTSANSVFSSSDGGATWQQRTLPVSGRFLRPIYADGLWALLPYSYPSYVLTSPDTTTWAQEDLPAAPNDASSPPLAVGGGVWLLGTSAVKTNVLMARDPSGAWARVTFAAPSPAPSLITCAAQATSPITAPTARGRVDRVVLLALSGVALVVTGTEADTPVAPPIPDGALPICRVDLEPGQTAITNGHITDERWLINTDSPASSSGGQSSLYSELVPYELLTTPGTYNVTRPPQARGARITLLGGKGGQGGNYQNASSVWLAGGGGPGAGALLYSVFWGAEDLVVVVGDNGTDGTWSDPGVNNATAGGNGTATTVAGVTSGIAATCNGGLGGARATSTPAGGAGGSGGAAPSAPFNFGVAGGNGTAGTTAPAAGNPGKAGELGHLGVCTSFALIEWIY